MYRCQNKHSLPFGFVFLFYNILIYECFVLIYPHILAAWIFGIASFLGCFLVTLVWNFHSLIGLPIAIDRFFFFHYWNHVNIVHNCVFPIDSDFLRQPTTAKWFFLNFQDSTWSRCVSNYMCSFFFWIFFFTFYGAQ